MPARTRRPNRRAVKLHRSYTTDEAARVLGCCKGTVRRWIRSGLPALTDQKPMLILGGDLRDFLEARSKPRSRCQLHECYCVKCRVPNAPAGGMADYIPLTPVSGNLRAICPTCGTLMHKRVAKGKLGAIGLIIDVSLTQAPPRIGDSPSPSSNDHIETEARTHA